MQQINLKDDQHTHTHIVEGVRLPVKCNELKPHVNGRSPLSVMEGTSVYAAESIHLPWVCIINHSCSR